MSLRDWRPRGWSIEKDICAILKAQKRTDSSTGECQQWAREFVQALIPGWQLGTVLNAQQAQLVGRAFSELQCPTPPRARKKK